MNTNTYTPQQTTGMIIMLTWMKRVSRQQFQEEQFICPGVFHATPQRLVSWLEVHLDDYTYSNKDKEVLNTIREFYRLNKDKEMTNGGWVWEIQRKKEIETDTTREW